MEKYYWAAWQIAGLSNSRIKNLVAFFGSASLAWQAQRRDLFVCGCFDENTCNNLLKQREKINIDSLAADWERKGINIVRVNDVDYPALLRQIYNPPEILYYRGRLPGDKALIAMVGARKASAYGRGAATMLAAGLAAAGLGIVSGAARGIDSAAHLGALQKEGYTVAVLGCGVDVVYPPENVNLLADIAENGAVVSEYAPGTAPIARFFPVRNRIISGLAKGVVVVEAAEKSGSLITADCALEQGRDVFAVPGNIFSAGSRGANRLIKQGAKPVESVEDILEEYGLMHTAGALTAPTVSLNIEEAAVYGALCYDIALGLEEMVAKTKLSPQVVTYILLRLELKGLIEKHSGQLYSRIPGRESVE